MFPREYLNDLLELNRLAVALREAVGSEGDELRSRIASIRGQLPTALVAHHDELERQGRASVAWTSADACSGCGGLLPAPMVAELNEPGRMSVCPHCGAFLTVHQKNASATEAER